MSKVWVVGAVWTDPDDWESQGDILIGVYSSEEGANKKRQELLDVQKAYVRQRFDREEGPDWDSYYITETELLP